MTVLPPVPPPSRRHPVRRRRRTAGTVALGAAAVLALIAAVHLATPHRTFQQQGIVPGARAGSSGGAPEAVPPASAGRSSGTSGAAAAAGPPARLALAAVGLNAPVDPVSMSAAGELGVPDNVHRLGWWAAGSEPGATEGTSVLDGHVDSAAQGAGALFHLDRTPVGAALEVSTAAGRIRYTVQARRIFVKTALPPDLFRTDGPPRLVLITCGGPFLSRTGHYSDNIVVYATPAKAPSR